MRENKERAGKTIRFSIRLPTEIHEWLKEESEKSREEGRYRSMNGEIVEIIKREKKRR